MANRKQTIFWILILLALPLSGCTSSTSEDYEFKGETLVESQNPCQEPSESMTQSMTSILVNGEERMFRLSVPSSDAGTKLAIIIAFHGGGDAEEDFPQQSQFDQLGEIEKFIMVYPIAEEERTLAEGDWFLNTAATSRDDNDFSESIVDELSKAYCVDEDRLYAIGYSLGSMFTYEIACQLSDTFAAVASFAGTMPVSPETCDMTGSMSVLHIHGKLDYIIDYDEDWDWKDVRDFKWLTNFFNETVAPQFEGGDQICERTGLRWDMDKLKAKTVELGDILRTDLKLEIADIGVEGSEFFKAVYINPSRMAPQIKEEQVENSIE